MGKKGPLWWRESDWLLRGSSAANQILLRHSGPILSANVKTFMCGDLSALVKGAKNRLTHLCVAVVNSLGHSDGSPITFTISRD